MCFQSKGHIDLQDSAVSSSSWRDPLNHKADRGGSGVQRHFKMLSESAGMPGFPVDASVEQAHCRARSHLSKSIQGRSDGKMLAVILSAKSCYKGEI